MSHVVINSSVQKSRIKDSPGDYSGQCKHWQY